MDRIEALRLETRHLVDLGHRSFGVLGFGSSNTWRWNGIVETLNECGLDPARDAQTFELDSPGAESYAEGIQLAQLVLGAKRRPTALIAINDRVASGAIQQLVDQGFRIPEDFSVVGFDNLPMGQHLRPTLTTIDHQSKLLIEKAGELLLEQLGKVPESGAGKQLRIEPRLIVRESTGHAPKSRAK